MPQRYWQNLTTTDFAELDAETAVALLPVAAIEQHGPHLPLATDALINEAIVAAALARVSDGLDVLALPALTVGASLEHTSFAGTLCLEPETLLAAWRQVGASVVRAGVRKLVILNTHGGQTGLVDIVALDLRARYRMLVARANYSKFGLPAGVFPDDALDGDIHGGLLETSLMLHIAPDLVRTSAARNFSGLPAELADRNTWLGVERPVGFGWLSEDLTASGASGNAAAADAERGAAYLEHIVTGLVQLLAEVAATPLAIVDDSNSAT
jgi:creatinine amidohydrolase